MTNLKAVEKVANELGTLENVKKELKRVQSTKCRLRKQKAKPTYQEEMTEVLAREQLLKEARSLIEPKAKPVTKYDQQDVDLITDLDECNKAIRSIQSKKSNSKYLMDEYNEALKIEDMLIERRKQLEPTSPDHVRKSDVETVIDTIKNNENLSKEKVLELLESLKNK